MVRESRESIQDVWGERTPYEGAWPARVDERLTAEPDQWVQSCCVLCSNGCALDIGVKDGRIVGVRGRAVDRVNRGRLGPKGLHGWEANHSPDRLTRPLIREGGKSADDALRFGAFFREASWDEAMDLIVRRSQEIIGRDTGGAIAFYNSGQMFIEDYYALALVAHLGVRTNHIDSNTRLCTATTGTARFETFGAAVQPGSYADIDVTDCLFLAGHNVAETQTVLWMRMLDRLDGPNPPKLVVLDPRTTATARRADVHLTPRLGTNVAALNGLLHLILRAGATDLEFLAKHTVGFDALRAKVAKYTPEKVQEIAGIPAERLRAAAQILSSAKSLVSTCLQGIYQSNQATAAAVQVNNLHLIRGLIGRPGCGVLQMNGQPTAQNTHETGATEDYAGFRNWANPVHMRDLARLWNVDLDSMPHWGRKYHILESLRYAELGSLKMLWVAGTNPAVSLPNLGRVRNVLASAGLFVVVQDAFMTETGQLADVILPAAIWAEKTGTFTNVDRTVHISHRAVAPPGEARPDLEIFLDYGRRMDFRDKDGAPLVKFRTAEEAFEAFKECTRGRPCDYSGLSYAKLSAGSGIPYPCNAEHPDGTERLFTDLVFLTDAEYCQDYGHDLETGAAITPEQYRAGNPAGRAILKAADYLPPVEEPDETYPFWLTTHRVVYHFQTRTKTGRSEKLQQAAPDAYVQMHAADAERLGIAAGDMVEVRTRRGVVQAPARLGDIPGGTVAIPYHYGYWDEREGRPRAADELTIEAWDPVSKQPCYKFAAAQVQKASAGSLLQGVAHLAARTVQKAKELVGELVGAKPGSRAHVADYLGLAGDGQEEFARACEAVAAHHPEENEIEATMRRFAQVARGGAEALRPFRAKYGVESADEAAKLRGALIPAVRVGAFGLLRDLHGLSVLAAETRVALLVLGKAAQGLGDREFLDACTLLKEQTERFEAWLRTQLEHRAPHTLVVPQ